MTIGAVARRRPPLGGGVGGGWGVGGGGGGRQAPGRSLPPLPPPLGLRVRTCGPRLLALALLGRSVKRFFLGSCCCACSCW